MLVLRPIWLDNQFSSWLQLPPMSQGLLTTLDALRQNNSVIPKLTFLIWSIWKEHNLIIFNNEKLNVHNVLHKASFLWKEWQLRMDVDSCHSIGAPFQSTSPYRHLQTPPSTSTNQCKFSSLASLLPLISTN